ncbi:MAG: hypothetical protein ACOC22_02985 [bacterium]
MTQKELDTLFEITITIHEDQWFGKRKNPRSREEVQEWVTKQLAESQGIYTIPCGMSWGALTTKQRFDEYWRENGNKNI